MVYFLYIISIFITAFSFYILLPHLIKVVIKTRQSATFRRSGKIYLTFDDGPHPDITPAILNILKAYKIKATFFLIGKNVVAYPQLVKQILKEGHEIGEHSYAHTHPWKVWPWVTIKDIKQGGKVITPFLPADKISLFRLPYGKWHFISLLYLLLLKKKPVFWTNDPEDYRHTNGKEVAAAIQKKEWLGAVILLHEERIDVKNNTNYQVTIDGLKSFLEATKEYQALYSVISEGLKPARKHSQK
jgi:peptidoglycan/xylan/chitin deacetylase (PgdA/CDA1 family)